MKLNYLDVNKANTISIFLDRNNIEIKQVEAMLKARESGRELIVSYKTNAAIMGGIVVKMGESVLDFSVQSRLERLCTKLAAPV